MVMPAVYETEFFSNWVSKLRDQRAKAKIASRIDRLANGNPGDVRPIGEGLSEMRVDHGPGYRVYYIGRGKDLVILLCGGDKSTQARDIEQAKEIAANLED